MTSKAEIQAIWRAADAVCFDVDSTVVQEEGIDELAKFCGKGDEVSRLTKEAMKGNTDFRDALRIRLGIINPTQDQLHEFVRLQPPTLTPGIRYIYNIFTKSCLKLFLANWLIYYDSVALGSIWFPAESAQSLPPSLGS